MKIVRFVDDDGTSTVGVMSGGELYVSRLKSISAVLQLSADEVESWAVATVSEANVLRRSATLLTPIDGLTEVWAAGVTYRRSREARIEESSQSSVYELVYDADRPEIFFKSPSWRVVADGGALNIRNDSALNVPEPELAVVVNKFGEQVGFCVCNDMSSRSLEAENPLYLPQAKIYDDSCSLSSAILISTDPSPEFDITMTIRRDGQDYWNATTSTASLARTIPDLLWHLHSNLHFPDGVFLSTGTGLVPELDFSLQADDDVQITIDSVGDLRNTIALRPGSPQTSVKTK